MRRYLLKIFLPALCFVLSLGADASPKEKKKGPPPAPVVVSAVDEGVIAPQALFTGTVYFSELSRVASEVSGKVRAVNFEEGERIKKGAVLARLDSEMLERDMEAARASLGEVRAQLEKAEKDFKRAEALHEKKLLSDSDFDGYRFAKKGLEKKALSLEAKLKSLKVQFEKKTVTAPFSGIILSKETEVGEWLSPGSPVATVADDSMVDILVNVPEAALPFIKKESAVEVETALGKRRARIKALIMKGDVKTRTFPVKIRFAGVTGLGEGMSARVRLPVGRKRKALIVDRDAITNVFGTEGLYAVIEGKAVFFPVRVIGYEGMKAGVEARGLKKGMKVVIKGNERLKNGRPVFVLKGAAG